MIKLLIVDDSALMRRYLKEMFTDESDFEIYTANNGEDALEKLHEIKPDVISLDINMPKMDGITCLSRIMVEYPVPVVILSSLSKSDAMVTFEAMALGAVDYIPKPGGTISLNIKNLKETIISKIRIAAKSKVKKSRNVSFQKKKEDISNQIKINKKKITIFNEKINKSDNLNGIVLIGVSTGGPQTLEEILAYLPAEYPYPIVIAQHMPSRFTTTFAARLNNICKLEVTKVTNVMKLEQGNIYLGKGDADIVIRKRGDSIVCMSVPSDNNYLWHPSVDKLVSSALEVIAPELIIGVLLTGMGYDGANTMKDLHTKGGICIAESEESCIVYGMPRELIERKGADYILSVKDIPKKIIYLAKR